MSSLFLFHTHNFSLFYTTTSQLNCLPEINVLIKQYQIYQISALIFSKKDTYNNLFQHVTYFSQCGYKKLVVKNN